MSNYHILDGRPDGNLLKVAFHLPVPDTNNDVGVNYRTALIEWLGGSQPSEVPFITSGEQTQLDDGELYELIWNYDTNPGEDFSTKLAALDSKFNIFSIGVVNQLEIQLGYWGYNRDVP